MKSFLIPYLIREQLRLRKVRKRYDPSCKIGTATVNQTVKLGKKVYLAENVSVRADVEIGDYSYVNKGTIVFKGTKIGKYCSIGYDVEIGPPEHPIGYLSTNPNIYRHEKLREFFPWPDDDITCPVSIGNDVWIGSKAIVLQGVTIGDGAIIAGGAIVKKDVEPFTIVGGVPAKFLRRRFDMEKEDVIKNSHWWDKNIEEIQILSKQIYDMEV